MGKPVEVWHIECGDLPACKCGHALAEVHGFCSSRDGAILEKTCDKLRALGWKDPHIVKGPCPALLEVD